MSQFTRAYIADGDFSADQPGTAIPFTASTPGAKRDNLDLRANGWRTENYHANGGVVLWQHDHQRPAIGSGRADSEPNRLRVAVVFDQEDEFARKIESKVRRGFIRASSVGWDFVDDRGRALDFKRMTPDYLRSSAYYDLNELSIVNVPADPSAVAGRSRALRRHLGKDFADLHNGQENPASDVTAGEVREALIELCRRHGIPLAENRPRRTGGRLVRAEDLPELLRGYGLSPAIANIPAAAGVEPSAPAAVDIQAARTLLAAFPQLKGAS